MSEMGDDALSVASQLVAALGKPIAEAAAERFAAVVRGRDAAVAATRKRLAEAAPDQRDEMAAVETQRWCGRIEDQMGDDSTFAAEIRALAGNTVTAGQFASPGGNQATSVSGQAVVNQVGANSKVSTRTRGATTINIRISGWFTWLFALMRAHIAITVVAGVVVAGGVTGAIIATNQGSAEATVGTTIAVDSQRFVDLSVVPPVLAPVSPATTAGLLYYFGPDHHFNTFDRGVVPYSGSGVPTSDQCLNTVRTQQNGGQFTASIGLIFCFAYPDGIVGYGKVVNYLPQQVTLQVVDLTH